MLVVHVHVRIRTERIGDCLAAPVINARGSLAEPGVLRFDIIQDQADPAHVVLTEVYRDDDASAAHKATPHYAVWRDTVADMMAEPPQSGRYSVVFPASSQGWTGHPPWGRGSTSPPPARPSPLPAPRPTSPARPAGPGPPSC